MFLQKEFYFVRHGQTDHNTGKIIGDHIDVPLNDFGREQARIIEPIIAALPIETVCFSPMKRAKETKELITPRLQVRHVEIANLTECSTNVWIKMTSLGRNALTTDDENVRSFIEQVRMGVNEALQQPGTVLIVAHGGVHWAMSCLMGGEHEWKIDHCIPVHFSLHENRWKAKRISNL